MNQFLADKYTFNVKVDYINYSFSEQSYSAIIKSSLIVSAINMKLDEYNV